MIRIFYKTSEKEVQIVEEGEFNLLRESIRYDAGVPYRCGGGLCGTCRVFIEAGAEHLSKVRKAEISRLGDDVEKGYRLACQTFASGDCSISWNPHHVKGKVSQKTKEYWTQQA